MPCSSSETGAGSNWESCCTALTAFLSAPAATSSRTESLLSTGGRSRARAPRVTRPGGGIGAPVLRSAVASSFPTRGNSVLPSTSAGFAAVRAFSGGENGGGRVDSEVRRTFSEDAAFALADSAGRMDRAGAVARNEDPLSSSPVSPSDAAAEECCIARRHNGGRDVEVVRSGGQDESAHRERGAIAENAVLVCAASDARPAMETPVTCTGSVDSSAASSAVAVIASVRCTGAASTSTEATSAVSSGCSGVNVASAVSHGSSVVNADVTSGDRGTNITPWRTWRNVRSGSVRAPLQIETTQLTRASYTSTGGWGPTTLLRTAETGDLLLVRPTSPQLSRQAHMAPPAGRAVPASRKDSERNDAPERGFPVAQPVDPAAVVSVETGSIRPPLSGRGARGRAAAHSASVPGQVCAPRETSGVNVVGADKGSAADRKPDDYALEGFPSRGTDRGEARVAAGTVGAAAAVDKGAEAPAHENAEDAERSDASQVVFYSPERSPPREAEADAPSLLLFGVETRQGKTRPQEACLSLSLAAAPQISRVLQKQGSEESGCSTATSAIMHGHAQLEGTAEELCTSLLSAGASAQEALHARAGQQDRRSAGQPARTVLPGIISGSGGASPAPSQSANVSSMVQDRAGDDTGMLIIRAEAVGVPAKDLQLPRTASRMPSGGLAYVTASESSAARETRGRMHCEPPTERPRRGPTPPGSVALVGGSESEGDSMLQRTLTTRAVASAGKGGAAETGRKGRLMAVGISSGRGKRVGQSTRQRSAQFGGEERSNAGDHLLAGERKQPSRRGRCQRPTSWKRVRQLTGEGQLSLRSSSLFIHAASHAVGRADNMQSEGLRPPQKWCGRQHSLEEGAAKPEPTASGYEKNDGETLSCNSIVACPLRSEPSGSQEKHSGRATEIIGGKRESGVSPKPVVSRQSALNKEGGRASSCEAGTECPGTTSRQTSTSVSDQGKEEASLSTTGLCIVDISPVVTALGAEGRSTGAQLKEGAAGLENKECLSGSDPGVPAVVARGMADDDSRKRSIGPGEFASFDEDTSGDESSVSAGDAGGPAWPRVVSSQSPPHSQVRVPRGRGAVFAEAECLPAANLSICMQALRPPELGCSPEDVDEDEASRFFKRRRCSLLLWGGIRNDRGHSAVQQASLGDAPAYSAPTSRDAGGGQEDSADNIPGVSTTSVCQVERVKQRQETSGSISAIASHKRCVRGRSEPETTTDERAAEKRRDEGSSGEESAGITGTGANADLVAPTVRRVSEAAASPLGTPAGFTSRLLRKRKRGVGACASRLLFLQRPGAGVSSEDAALVNSLSSALTYEETQQLRRLEHEHRQLELLRQQEEARRKEQAAAARLREQQKAAAAVIAAAASARTLPPCPFVFGSAAAAVAPTSGSDAVAPATLPAQGETHRATTFVEESRSGTAPTRSTRAPSQPKSAAESTGAQMSVPASLSCERRSASQSTEQQPQTREPFLSGRPKLRIIRSPAAGDTAVSALPAAGDAGGGLAGPAVGGAAVGSVAHTQSSEGSSGSAASSLQQAELPAAFGGGSGGLPPSRVGGLFGVAQQPPMRTGILPAEFGGAAGATGATGTGVAGSGGFGIASAFGVTSAGPSVSAANPFAFQRGGRGLRKGGR